MKIAVLGAGSFGCALANVLNENNDVIVWTNTKESCEKLTKTYENPYIKGAKMHKDISFSTDISVVNNVDYIFFVVPSFALREVSKKINEVAKNKINAVICTKGMEKGTLKSSYQVVKEEIENLKNIAILSGPTHAEEIAFNKYTTIVATSKDIEYAKEIQNTVTTNRFRVYTNTDVIGVEILGAAKNVLAIAAGLCDSHPSLGDNAKAALLTRGLGELKEIGLSQGCRKETFYGLTGLGDLIVTATSKHSRNRKYGELLGQGLNHEEIKKEIGMVVEGIYSVESIYQLSQKSDKEFPIIEAIYNGIFSKLSVDDILEQIFQRNVRKEC